MEFYVDFLGSLMDALQLERVSLVGILRGGGAALGFTFRSPQRVERLVLVDKYGLGDEVPRGWLDYLLVHTLLVDILMYLLLRRSRCMVRWSLYNLLHYRRVLIEMVEGIYRLVNKPEAGRAFSSFQKNEVGWNGLHTSFIGSKSPCYSSTARMSPSFQVA
jgi:pimeloyl-ACP methyl ester carboxylesterase